MSTPGRGLFRPAVVVAVSQFVQLALQGGGGVRTDQGRLQQQPQWRRCQKRTSWRWPSVAASSWPGLARRAGARAGVVRRRWRYVGVA